VDRRDHAGRHVGQALIGSTAVARTPLPSDPLVAARRRHPAGRLLAARARHPTARIEPRRQQQRTVPRFGNQPGLDGLRALSVAVVIGYHAGFPSLRGGWIGVEVFFVVSGFLITTLLLEERGRTGRIDVRRFWGRRARRLLPALGVMLAAVAVWALVAGTDQQLSQLRRDFPWALLYAGNWGQIVGDVPYYAGDQALLRHLWSLGIEEQFYLVWPVAFIAIAGSRLRRVSAARLIGALALASMVTMIVIHATGPGPLGDVDRTNFLYLSTVTRAGGLLAGAAAAFVWRPWRPRDAAGDGRTGVVLDVAGAAAVAMLGCAATAAVLTDAYVYQWLLPLVSLLSLVAVMVVVHPAASGMRRLLGWGPLVAVGRRSYGLYLWHWPIFVCFGVRHGSAGPFAAALVVTVICSELCYRHVELPARRGAIGRWWRSAGPGRVRVAAAGAAAVAVLGGLYAAVGPYDRAQGGEATFRPPAPAAPPAATPTTAAGPELPRRVAILGDSQAHSLAVNQPRGLAGMLAIVDGSLDGCSVYDAGSVRSTREGFGNSFSMCEGWPDDWAAAVAGADAEIALVVLGAWDVFDLDTGDGEVLPFGSVAWDGYFSANLQRGVDAVAAAGARVALLEVPCMRPKDVEGAGVPALPERGDDARVAHVNGLLRDVAAANTGRVAFVDGPGAWCDDETVANDRAMRWDGVHVYQPGAALIYETITPSLLAL
jgi:peptidoglycan/LPS O-acetylase OafA/YrhL